MSTMEALSFWPLVNTERIIGLILFTILGVLAIFFIRHLNKVRRLLAAYNKILNTFNELDEQAKLIVKTDLELNKAQEELDKRIAGLNALQRVSHLVTTTLDENEIFQRLNQPLLKELGFEKYLVLIFNNENMYCRVNINFIDEELQKTMTSIQNDPSTKILLQQGRLISSLKQPETNAKEINRIFNIKSFVIAPITVQGKISGILFAGNQSSSFVLTEGDEELISILADQIGKAVENAKLFEQAYRSTQMLEVKVQERTKELSSALEEVKKISKMKSEFISAVSHELRTPLTSIKGYAALLMTGKLGEIPDQVKERLEKINKHSDNLVKLINDLLDIARIEAGRIEMKFMKFNIASLVENVQDLLTPQIKDKNLNLAVDVAPHIPEILIDVNQIERVLINLVGNAIKFTRTNGTVSIKISSDDKKITVAVSDTGIGISEENIAKLFNEFYRVENEINQSVKGSGLGLALAKNIIEAHHGRIWVTSKLHQGSTFYFTLPFETLEQRQHRETP